MPGRCVAGGCSAFPDVEKGLVLHAISFYNDDRPEARKRRKKWVEFVKQKRAKWEPTRNSSLCSGISLKMTSFVALPLPTRQVGSPSFQDLNKMNLASMLLSIKEKRLSFLFNGKQTWKSWL